MTTTYQQLAHAEAERIWSLNYSDRKTEEFESLLAVVERTQRGQRLIAKLPEEQQFLRYHVVALTDSWAPLSALYGDENKGTRCGEYDTLVWLGIAERKVEALFTEAGRPMGSRSLFRLAQTREDETMSKTIGELRVGETLQVDGAEWVVAELNDGRNEAWTSILLTRGPKEFQSQFLTGGWKRTLVSTLGITA